MKEILDRANVGRSTFYTHFRDKDELLASSIHEMISSARSQKAVSAKPYERIIRFSLPIFEYLDQHRHQHLRDGTVDAHSRAVLHEHLQNALEGLIDDDVERFLRSRTKATGQLPSEVLVHYVASTFVLVLNWWIDTESRLTPQEVNDLFRALVVPTLVIT